MLNSEPEEAIADATLESPSSGPSGVESDKPSRSQPTLVSAQARGEDADEFNEDDFDDDFDDDFEEEEDEYVVEDPDDDGDWESDAELGGEEE